MRTRTRVFAVSIGAFLVGCLVALPALADAPDGISVRMPTEVRTGRYLSVDVYVYDAAGYLVDLPASDNLIVVEDNSGKTTSFVPFTKRLTTGTYHAGFSLPHSGTWTIVIAPDTPFAVVKSVTSYSATARFSSEWLTPVIALAVLGVLLVVLLGNRLRRSRFTGRAAPTPEAHDTWWW
jgi:hypothetical protein